MVGSHIIRPEYWLFAMLVTALLSLVSPSVSAQSLTPDPDAEITRGIAKVNVLKLGKAAQNAYDERDMLPALERTDAIFAIVDNMVDENGEGRAELYKSSALKLHRAGYYFPAERLFYKAYRFNAEQLGEYHPFTLSSLNNLASNFNAQGRFAEAAVHYQEVLRFRTLILGSQDPLTINSLANLGYTYKQQGQLAKAQELLEQALKRSVDTRGRSHPENAKLMILLSDVLGNEKFASDSEIYLRDALKMLVATKGPYHPDTMSCLHRLGTNLSMQKKYSEAEPYFYHAWTRRESKLGKENAATLQSKQGLIASLNNQGLQKEANRILGVVTDTSE